MVGRTGVPGSVDVISQKKKERKVKPMTHFGKGKQLNVMEKKEGRGICNWSSWLY